MGDNTSRCLLLDIATWNYMEEEMKDFVNSHSIEHRLYNLSKFYIQVRAKWHRRIYVNLEHIGHCFSFILT